MTVTNTCCFSNLIPRPAYCPGIEIWYCMVWGRDKKLGNSTFSCLSTRQVIENRKVKVASAFCISNYNVRSTYNLGIELSYCFVCDEGGIWKPNFHLSEHSTSVW